MNLKRLTAGILAMLAIAACKEETPYMELSQKKFTIGEEGGRINVELKANVYYRVVNENDFVTISAEGNDAETANYIIDVKANENIAKPASNSLVTVSPRLPSISHKKGKCLLVLMSAN